MALDTGATAIISDVHGNLPALKAVLSHIRAKGIPKEQTFCLGDIVGYGPQPNECVELVRQECGIVLRGNHDVETCSSGPLQGVQEMWHKVFHWTRSTVTKEHKNYLASLPLQVNTRFFVAAHGKPGKEVGENCYICYALPDRDDGTPDDDGRRNMEEIHQYLLACNLQDPDVYLAVFGHIHKPYYYDDEKGLRYISPDIAEHTFARPAHVALLSVPAVGLPRDKSWRTGLAFVEEDKCTVVRLKYDAKSVLDAILKSPSYPYNSAIRRALTGGLQWTTDTGVFERLPDGDR